MFDGRGVANLILDRCDELDREVTNLKLQKILYFCHAWFLANRKKALIRHKFEAWEYGPVLPYVYRDLKGYADNPIKGRIKQLHKGTGTSVTAVSDIDEDEKRMLCNLIDIYSNLSSSELVKLSHAVGGPWCKVWNHDGEINPGMQIHNDMILEFYSLMH